VTAAQQRASEEDFVERFELRPHLAARFVGAYMIPSAARASPVSALAVPYPTGHGRRVFSGAYDLTRTPLSALPRHPAAVLDGAARDRDSRGRVIASDRPGAVVTEARDGRVVAEHGIDAMPWTVVASVSETQLLAPVSGARAERAEGPFEHAAIEIALVGLDGRCLRGNPPPCATLGYAESELLRINSPI
jgi:PAS domain-containing protein